MSALVDVNVKAGGTTSVSEDETVVFGRVGRVFIVRWRESLTTEAMQRAWDAMFAARRAVSAPLVNLSVLPPQAHAIPDGPRERLQARYEVIRHLCEAIYVVIEGAGLGPALIRSVVSVQSLLARMPIEATDCVEDAVEKVALRVRGSPETLLAEARARGLLL